MSSGCAKWDTPTIGVDPTSVGADALALGPRLRADFRLARKRDSPFWDRCDKWERDTRKRLGVLVLYLHLECVRVRPEFLDRLYAFFPPAWGDFEVSEGFRAELPPVLSYYARYFAEEPRLPWWRVFFAEWIAIVAAA